MTEGSAPRLTELAQTLGMEITECSEGSCVVECTVASKHLNMGGWPMEGYTLPFLTQPWVGLWYPPCLRRSGALRPS